MQICLTVLAITFYLIGIVNGVLTLIDKIEVRRGHNE